MLGKIIFMTLLVMISITVYSIPVKALRINELMYNPSSDMGDDSDLEWIELYADEELLLSEYVLTVDDKSFNLPNITLNASSYIIIARELEDSKDKDNNSFSGFYGLNISAFERKISLSNSGDYLSLHKGEATLHAVNYSDDWGADGNGFSLEFYNDFFYESIELGGTPGRDNSYIPPDNNTGPANDTEDPGQEITSGLKISTYIDDIIYTGLEYTKLFKVQNLDHIRGVYDCVNATIKYSIYFNNTPYRIDFIEIRCMNSLRTADTGFFVTELPGDYELCGNITRASIDFTPQQVCKNFTVIDTTKIPCDISLTDIELDRFIYWEKEKIGYKFILNNKSLPFTITYDIRDVFGEEIRSEKTTDNTNKKRFTPSGLKESDKVYEINAEVFPLCDDQNASDNRISEFLVVKRREEETVESSLLIKNVLTKDPKPGSSILIELQIYKGDTNKRVVNLYATTKEGKKISDTTKVYLKEKFVEYGFTIPIQLKPDCDARLKPGFYFVVADGLGIKEKYRFKIENTSSYLCPKQGPDEEDRTPKKKMINYTSNQLTLKQLMNITESETTPKNVSNKLIGNTVYRSASVRSVELLPFLFFITSALVSILIIIKRL